MAFTFGIAGGNGGSSSGASNPSQTSTSGLFGNNSASTPAASVFGQSSASTTKPASTGQFGSGGAVPATSSPFGGPNTGGTQTSNLFGGGNNGSKPASEATAPSLFDGLNPSGGMFGKPAPTSSSSTGGMFGTSTTPNSSFSGPLNSTPTSNETKASTPAPSGSLFSNLNTPSAGNTFGGASIGNTTAPTGSTTPAPSKLNFSGASTTPAGPPPTDNSSKPTSSLFGSVSQPSSGLFDGSTQPDATKAPAATSSLFSGAKPSVSGGLFTGASKPNIGSGGSGLFSNLGSTPTTSGASGASTTAASRAQPTFSFAPSQPSVSTPNTQPTASAAAPATPSLFNTSAASPRFPAATSTSNIFEPASSTSTSAPGTSAPVPASAPSLSNNGPGGNATTMTSNTAGPTSTAPPPSTNLFNQKAPGTQPIPTPLATSTAGPSATGLGASTNQQAGATLGASTAGPPSQLTRLKNKTMDEIITRWASDLSKYQKEFQDQAAKVASWDRLLVENGDKIQTLYLSTFEAERQSAEIERQLSNVESQQAELSSWLDRYEAEVDDMFSRQVGQGDNLQGPDQERERTYKLAEKLTDRLDDMGKNLTGMIEAINDATTTLSKTSKPDDPLAHIVRVLNSHLTQLQWIDQNAEILQKKVADAQKMGQSIGSNGYGGPESDAADSFYRSYSNRR